MVKTFKKFLMVIALFATIFSAASASAESKLLSDMTVEQFVGELQKNLAEKLLEVNDLQRARDLDMEDGTEPVLGWSATLTPKGSSAGGDRITFFTDKENHLLAIGAYIVDGATQEIVNNNFWEVALNTLNFTTDERTQILKGGAVNENGLYISRLQKSADKKIAFGSGKIAYNTLFSFLSIDD